jgi:hypothetical protein
MAQSLMTLIVTALLLLGQTFGINMGAEPKTVDDLISAFNDLRASFLEDLDGRAASDQQEVDAAEADSVEAAIDPEETDAEAAGPGDAGAAEAQQAGTGTAQAEPAETQGETRAEQPQPAEDPTVNVEPREPSAQEPGGTEAGTQEPGPAEDGAAQPETLGAAPAAPSQELDPEGAEEADSGAEASAPHRPQPREETPYDSLGRGHHAQIIDQAAGVS